MSDKRRIKVSVEVEYDPEQTDGEDICEIVAAKLDYNSVLFEPSETVELSFGDISYEEVAEESSSKGEGTVLDPFSYISGLAFPLRVEQAATGWDEDTGEPKPSNRGAVLDAKDHVIVLDGWDLGFLTYAVAMANKDKEVHDAKDKYHASVHQQLVKDGEELRLINDVDLDGR